MTLWHKAGFAPLRDFTHYLNKNISFKMNIFKGKECVQCEFLQPLLEKNN